MKKYLILIVGLLFISSFSANAQKFGYCKVEKIIQIMPEYETAQAKIEGELRSIEAQAEEMQVEFNQKYKNYTDNMSLPKNDPDKWSPSIQQVKEQELTQLQQRIQDFQMSAQQDLQQRQVDLMEPVYNKVDSAINVVMKQENYIMIIKNLDAVQVNKDKCDDVSPFVKKILGLD